MIFKFIFFVLLIPIGYLIVSLLLTFITANKKNTSSENFIYLNTNGVHLDIILPVSNIKSELKQGLKIENASYVAFGWGEKNFYLNVPDWDDLTFNIAFKAMFLKSEALIHLTRYETKRDKWVKVYLTEEQLKTLNNYILKSFVYDDDFSKHILHGKGYTPNDEFYKANGSYTCLNTCNSWVNRAFKESDLKACLWTPFDFGLINIYNE